MKKNKIKKRKSKKLFNLSDKRDNSFFNFLEIDLESDSKFSIFEVIIVVFISILFGVIVGYLLCYSKGSFSVLNSNSKISEVIDTYDNIKSNYYDKIDEDELVNAAIEGMVNSLGDPHSNYMNSEITEEFNESIKGSFVGIGVTVSFEDDYNKIIEVVKKGPAYKAGIKKNDIIIKVNGKDVKGLYGNKLSSLIRGKIGTKVKITVKRDGKLKDIVVIRNTVEINSVSHFFVHEDSKTIGYLKINTFASNTYKQFEEALTSLEEKKKIDSLIIDVRNNPGGHLSQTRLILSEFFDKDTVLYRIQRNKKVKKVYSLNNKSRSYPVVILINGNSASASEVLTSCFMENYKDVLVVGVNSYGKGTVQKTQKLSTGTSIKYTVERWLTSKGKNIDGVGLKPDIEVKQNKKYFATGDINEDTQYDFAIEKLKSKKS